MICNNHRWLLTICSKSDFGDDFDGDDDDLDEVPEDVSL